MEESVERKNLERVRAEKEERRKALECRVGRLWVDLRVAQFELEEITEESVSAERALRRNCQVGG